MKAVVIEPISQGQYFWLVATSVVVGGVYIWPQYVVLAAQQNALWTIVGSVVVAYGITWVRVAWIGLTQGTSYVDVLQRTWGTWGMWIVFAVNIGIGVPLDIALLALYGQLMHTIFYPATPGFVIDMVVVAAGVWIARKPLNGVARNVQFWFPGLVALVVAVSFLGFYNVHHRDALVPSNVVQIRPILHGIGVTWYLFVQSELVIFLAAHVRNTTTRQIHKLARGAILFHGFWLMLFYVIVVGTLGPEATEVLRWPIVYVFSSIVIRSVFVSGVGTVILLTWTIAFILFLAVHAFCWSWNLQIMLGSGATSRTIILVALGVAMIIASTLIPSPVWASSVVVNFVNPADMLFTAAVVLPAFAISWLRFRGRPL
jgi:hypothetical protein